MGCKIEFTLLVGSRQSASRQLAVGNQQLALGSQQLAVGKSVRHWSRNLKSNISHPLPQTQLNTQDSIQNT